MDRNKLFFGNNLKFLRRPEHFATGSIDLIYLDPPFNSKADYNVLFKEQDGSRAAAQAMAFVDTWEWNTESAAAYFEFVQSHHTPELARRALIAMHDLLGGRGSSGNSMIAYLSMMAPRLVELHRVLKPTGSIYLHCDPTASHYLKLLIDSIFSPDSFRNEVIWKRTTSHSSSNKYAPIHDVILYYSKSKERTWNSARTEYDSEYIKKYYRFDDGDGRLYWRNSLTAAGTRKGSSGQPWHGIDVAATGQHWKFTLEHLDELDAKGLIYWPPGGGFPQIKRYRDELKGKAVADIWDDIDRINPVGGERLGYQTQKPEALLERIILASSNEGDVVLDPFCGCGTAIAVAQRLGRRWIGIDITYLAIDLIKRRLEDQYGKQIARSYQVLGEPDDISGAEALAKEENGRYQFQYWALSKLDARLISEEKKKGADKGVDGRLYFHDDMETGETKKVVCSVKSGDNIGVKDIRDLRGTMERDKAAIGVFITLREPTKPMRDEAIAAGVYRSPWGTSHPRLQIVTIVEILAGKKIDMPPSQDQRTFKKAPKAKKKSDKADYSTLPFAAVMGEDGTTSDLDPCEGFDHIDLD